MSKGRILVVEDLPDWRATLSGILFDEGYEVCAAGSRQEALQLLAHDRFHLAVLDVRLDESDESNREGLELMRQIRAYDPTTLVIVLTGYADVSMVQEALRPQNNGLPLAYSFVEKMHPEELLEYVRRAFDQEIKINWNLAIQTDDNFLQKIASGLRFTDHPKPAIPPLKAEIDELLRKLFATSSHITLQPLKQGFSGAAVFRVEPYYQRRGRGESVVAKLAEWPLIEQEKHNFTQAVQGVVGGHRLPNQIQLARTRSLGGLLYTFAGLGGASSFVDFYAQAAAAEIIPVLENLLLETCFPWGRQSKIFQPAFNYTEHYLKHLHLNPHKLNHALSKLFGKRHCLAPGQGTTATFQFMEHALLNPVEFVFASPLSDKAQLAPVHGDLTGYNVILDRHRETWLIDFGRTGPGVLLQDFASLENYLKISLLETDDPRSFYLWEKELAHTPTLEPSVRFA
ncbi:MAG: response regulator [Anaerolineae bacterium]